MIPCHKPHIASKGDVLQHALQALGINQKAAAYAGALKDLSCGDLAGYHKNLFESATGYDPGRLAGALMSRPFGCVHPGIHLKNIIRTPLLRTGVPTGKVRARRYYHTPFGTTQIERRDLNGSGLLGKLKGRALEARLRRDMTFRARFEAAVGGTYVPDSRNDGKVTIRRHRPNIFGLRSPIFKALSRHILAARVLGGLVRMQPKNVTPKAKPDADSAVSKLGPGACFEDFVAAFMQDVVREQQKEAKDKMNELNELNKKSAQLREQKNSGGSKVLNAIGKGVGWAGALIGGFYGGPAGFSVGRTVGNMAGQAISNAGSKSKEDINSELETNGESRQMKMEELKQIMQRLSSMQQALSNVLNTMHQGSMNAVRNIRA